MNAAVQAVPGVGAGVQMGQALISGKIVAKSRAITTQQGRKFLTVVALPAADEYSTPQVVELRSNESLGQAGETVRCRVSIGGYRRSFDTQDPHTGEKFRVQSAQVMLDVIG